MDTFKAPSAVFKAPVAGLKASFWLVKMSISAIRKPAGLKAPGAGFKVALGVVTVSFMAPGAHPEMRP